MKKIFTLLLLTASFAVNAQVKVESFDEFTKVSKTEYRVAGKQEWRGADNLFKGSNIVGRFYLSKRSSGSEEFVSLNMFLNYISGCIAPDRAKIVFLLENSDTVELKNFAAVDCGKVLYPKFDINDDQIKTLANNLIKGVRFYYTDGYVDLPLRDGKNEAIKKTFELFIKDTEN